MKRMLVLLVFLLLLFCLQGVAFSQSKSGNFEQEQASAIAQEIARQKLANREGGLADVKVTSAGLLEEGNICWANRDFENAKIKFKEAIKLEPNNHALYSLLKNVEMAEVEYRKRQALVEREIIEQKRILETDQAWLVEEPELTIGLTRYKKLYGNKLKEEAQRKIVSIDFNKAQLKKVFDYLTQASGINIIMDESAVSRAGDISIRLNEVSLLQALEDIVKTKGLGYRFENNFIWISTKEDVAKENLVTRIYPLSQGLAAFTTFTTFDTVTVNALRGDSSVVAEGKPEAKVEVSGTSTGKTASLSMPAASSASSAKEGVTTYEGVKVGGPGGVNGKIIITIKDVLKDLVDWPEGARIFLDNRTSTLIVRNTPSNLAIIEEALQVLDVNPPQVMIEARFVEVGADDLFNLGLKITPQVTASGASETHTYPFHKDQDTKYSGPFTATNTNTTDFTFGKLDFSQFQAVLSAIEQNKNSNTLSSPRITTISGQEAVIKIVKEYRYPTKYDIKPYESGSGDNKTTYYAVVPAEFKSRDIGIILKVTPNVGADGKTINLTLVPEVSEFDIEKDMYNFGTDLQPYKQPFFAVRNCTASIVVNNNDTVVMGGLIRETVEHTIDRVPVLGKIPLLGNLFSRKYDNRQKRNLLIFVTARIIAPSGKTVRN